MLATTADAKKNVRTVVRWLKRRFDYEENDLPTGLNTNARSCPIACAIKSTGKKHVSVGQAQIEVDGKYLYLAKTWYSKDDPDFKSMPDVPESVKQFIRNFDARVYGWTDYEGEGC